MKNVAALWIVASLFLASLEPIIAKFAYVASATPWTLFFVKSFTGLVFGVLGWRKFKLLSKSQILLITFLGLLLSITSLLSLIALTRVTAIVAVTFVSVTPALVALVNSYLGRDILSLKFWVGFILCFTGVALSLDFTNSFSSFKIDSLGFTCLSGALISSTLYRALLERVTQTVVPTTVSSLMFFTNAILTFILLGAWQIPLLNSVNLGFGLWLGIAAIVANIAFVKCIALLGSTRSSIINMLQRPLVVIFAALLLDEPMNRLQWIGVVLVFLGIYLARSIKRKGIQR